MPDDMQDEEEELPTITELLAELQDVVAKMGRLIGPD